LGALILVSVIWVTCTAWRYLYANKASSKL
jgi:hypothetical protein